MIEKNVYTTPIPMAKHSSPATGKDVYPHDTRRMTRDEILRITRYA